MTPGPTQGGNTSDAAGDSAPRPKFSRRPASFSRPTAADAPLPTPAEPSELLAAPVGRVLNLPAPATHHATAWQEDARFGVAMLLLVLLVNLALIYGLPFLPRSTASQGPTHVAAKGPSMPEAVGRSRDGVTLYSQPPAERRTLYMLDLRNHAAQQDALSVSPNDIPAPNARALDAPPLPE